MDKDASLFSSLSGSLEKNIYVDDDYSLTVSRSDNVEFQHGRISNFYIVYLDFFLKCIISKSITIHFHNINMTFIGIRIMIEDIR